MTDPFSIARDAMFSTQVAVDAEYTPVGTTETKTVRVVWQDRDEDVPFGQTGGVARSAIVEVRLGDVPCPAKGDGFAVNGIDYLVIGTPMIDRAFGTAKLQLVAYCD